MSVAMAPSCSVHVTFDDRAYGRRSFAGGTETKTKLITSTQAHLPWSDLIVVISDVIIDVIISEFDGVVAAAAFGVTRRRY